jgi:hypothetical protein
MGTTEDVRWIQRYNHFNKALNQLAKFIDKGELNDLEKQGLVHAFEYTYELVWNTIKDYFENQGESGIHGSRDAIHNINSFKRRMLFLEEPESVTSKLLTLVLTHNLSGKTIHGSNLVALMYDSQVRLLITENPSEFSRFPELRIFSAASFL